MPAKSEAQRGYLNAHFGHDWVKEHGFDNKGPLPAKVKRKKHDYEDGAQHPPDDVEAMRDALQGLEPPLTVMKARNLARRLQKGQAHGATMNLRVHGMSRTPDGQLSYRMVTRDNHYVGRTNPSKIRAKKGDVLRVQANDFLQDDVGDLRWNNSNVVAQSNDAAHSWRELSALAGGQLEKDEADGPAGDIPASNDQRDPADLLARNGQAGALAATVGPTISDVHVPRPLTNISVAYAGKKVRYQVQKADRHQQLFYGVVLEPNTMDSQDDFMLPDQVEKTAHGYLKKAIRGKGSVSKLQHRTQGFFKTKPGVVPVESFIAPVDFSYDGQEMVKKGTWVMVLHVEDKQVWQDVLNGKYTGLSIGGTGIRQEMSVPDDVVPHGYIEPQQPADWFR